MKLFIKQQIMDGHLGSGSFSQLQYLLQLAHSDKVDDQQKAAVNLAKLVEGNVFPAVSFGPLAHSLCKLVPNPDRTVASYASRALKLLLLDDALRPQANSANVPNVVCSAVKQWDSSGEVMCLRELLGALQTLCWDKHCVKGVIQNNIIPNLIEYIQANDQEVSVLAVATLTNILQFSDTLLLTDNIVIESLSASIIPLLTILNLVRGQNHHRSNRFYTAAALANATAHPRLANLINQNGGLQCFKDIERLSMSHLHILGSRMGDCAQTAIFRLTERREGDASLGQAKYSFKYGTQPTMELSFAAFGKNQNIIIVCFIIWIVIILITFSPLLFV